MAGVRGQSRLRPNIANIVWAHFLGVGVVEPVDDFRVSNPPSNPELLDYLGRRLAADRFDLRPLVREICNSAPISWRARGTRPMPGTNAISRMPGFAGSGLKSCSIA